MTTAIGGRYRATQAEGGLWTIHDVPVFADTKRTFKANGGVIDRTWDGAWQQKAVETGMRRKAANGYMGRLHVHHQGGPEKPEPVGFIEPVRVDKMTFDEDGKPVEKSITRVNYVGLSDAVLKRFMDGEFAYASAEIPMDGRAEISSVALLPVAPPWHKLPPQTIGEVVPAAVGGRSGNPVVAFHDTREAIQVLTRFPLPEVISEATTTTAGIEPVAVTITTATTSFQEEPGKPESKDAKPAEKPDSDANESGDLNAQVAEILSILKGLAGMDKKPENPVDALPVVEMKDPVPPAKFAEEIGKRDATIQGLTEKIAKFEAKEKEDAAVAASLKALEGVSGVDEKSVRDVYAQFSEVGLKAWTEGRKVASPAEPTKEWAEGEDGKVKPDVDSAKFADEFATMPSSFQAAYPGGKTQYVNARRAMHGLPEVKE